MQSLLWTACPVYSDPYNRVKDSDRYLEKGTNKQVFYKVFTSPDEIDEQAIKKLLHEAVGLDGI